MSSAFENVGTVDVSDWGIPNVFSNVQHLIDLLVEEELPGVGCLLFNPLVDVGGHPDRRRSPGFQLQLLGGLGLKEKRIRC